jgi:uncharacterized protein
LRYYLDTSFVVSAYSVEPRTDDCQFWLAKNFGSDLVISDWVTTEFSSAVALKIRTKEISVDQRAEILTRWRKAVRTHFAAVDIVRSHFETAAQMADNYKLTLRAGDALHIAVAQSAGCTLVTLDKRMAEAAVELGVPVAKIPASK